MTTNTRRLDLFTYSPISVRKDEFFRAFEAIREQHPGVKLEYIGCDGELHYFQEWGNKVPYTTPIVDSEK